MPRTGEGSSESDQLASNAGPVRRWLTNYFRRRLGDQPDVEDMVQDVFVRIASRDSEQPIENLNGYVMSTASSVMADSARRCATHRASHHISFDPEMHAGEDFDPERVLSDREDLNAATAALLSLPERTRRIFLLCRLEGHRQRDVADLLGISVSAVEKHMVKAVRHLSAEMEKHHAS